jgi:signal recognition particle subunit SRP54
MAVPIDVARLLQGFEEVADEEKAERDALRMLKGQFDMNDFHEQITLVRKIEGTEIDHEELVDIAAMVSSMTDDERRHPELFVVTNWDEIVERDKRNPESGASYDTSRLRRVAQGAGRKEHEVADLLHRFATLRQIMMRIGKATGLSG